MRNDEYIKGYLSLNQLCVMLEISLATGKNWLKLGKIIPSKYVSKDAYFDKKYCEKLLNDLSSGSNADLKSRRNKSFKSGFGLYKSYIPKDSKNIVSVQKLIDIVEDKSIKLSKCDIAEIIAHYARKIVKTVCETDYSKYKFLCDDISQTAVIIEKYPNLGMFNFIYKSNEDILGLLYMSLTGINKRKSQGAYFTPTNVVKKLIAVTFENYKRGDVIDPCCGSGNFILNLPTQIPFQNIYAGDIDELSVKIARLNFALKYKVPDKKFLYEHVKIQDFLHYNTDKKYDYIIGNPPWAYNFTQEEKEFLRKKYKTAQNTNIESYDVITECALNKLNKNGTICFVLPESVLNVKTHSPLRGIITKRTSIKYLEYLGETFDGVQCPSIIAKISYNNRPFCTKGLRIKNKDREFVIQIKRPVDSDVFSFNCDDKEYELLERIENIPNKVTLKDNALFALGIVTGNNTKYLSVRKTKDTEPILKGTDVEKYKIKNAANYIVYKPNEFQQCAPEPIYRAKEKLVYKFISKKLVFAYDNAQTLTLNSCNILIPQIKGLDIKYVLAVLNSRIAQFYFEKKFNSVKVLRSHLEQIPIPYVDYETQKPIIETVDKIMSSSDYINLISELDKKIRCLY